MSRVLRHCQPLTIWDGLGRLLTIAKAFHMVRSRSFRGCTLSKATTRLGEPWPRRVSEGHDPMAPGLPAGADAAVPRLLIGRPTLCCRGGSSHAKFFFGNMLTRGTWVTD